MSSAKITLQSRPKTFIDPSLSSPDGTFSIERGTIPTAGDLKGGEVLVRSRWLSLDPAMRGWLNETRSYIEPVKIGNVMRAAGVGVVVESKFAGLEKGDEVFGRLGWQTHPVLPGSQLRKLVPSAGITSLDYLGPLGLTGQTAYWGLVDVGKIKEGETVVVSGAAGAVGSLTVQIAKLRGCRVIGIAGGPEKRRYLLEELKVDVALDYKSPTFRKDFEAATPDYVDVYFDNVGGDTLDMVLGRLRKHARVVLCGAISDYNKTEPTGIKRYVNLIMQEASMAGFVVLSYQDRFHLAEKEMATHLSSGALTHRWHVLSGLEACPQGLSDLFVGKNTGKTVVWVGEWEIPETERQVVAGTRGKL